MDKAKIDSDVDNPQVSIIMATRNRVNLLERAVLSVIEQSFTDWEFLIVDDASTDGTGEFLARVSKKDKRFKILQNKQNRGLAASHNRALKESRGKYMAVLDDDDWWHRLDKLERQVEFLENNPGYVVVGGGVVVVDEEGNERYRYLKPETDEEIREKMLFANPFAHSTVMYRREAAENAGFYDERFSGHAADRDLFLKLGKMGKLYNIQEYFTSYLLSDSNMLVRNQRRQLKASFIYMKRHREHYPNYLPALYLNGIIYAYSFLPRFLRGGLNSGLLYVKRSIFDNPSRPRL